MNQPSLPSWNQPIPTHAIQHKRAAPLSAASIMRRRLDLCQPQLDSFRPAWSRLGQVTAKEAAQLRRRLQRDIGTPPR